jgi:hypothetical protein
VRVNQTERSDRASIDDRLQREPLVKPREPAVAKAIAGYLASQQANAIVRRGGFGATGPRLHAITLGREARGSALLAAEILGTQVGR